MNNKQHIGITGETLVADYLQRQGYTIMHRNFKRAHGEIDLIACKKNILAFVEVKTRSKAFFDISSVITFAKQQKIILTAKQFLAENQDKEYACRFDVALIEQLQPMKLSYIPNAFTEDV